MGVERSKSGARWHNVIVDPGQDVRGGDFGLDGGQGGGPLSL
jgi:hypothetical protein